MAIVLRLVKGSTLTFQELDGNFSDLDSRTNILETNKTNWDTAYSWGDHSLQSYLANTDVTTNAPTNGQILKYNGNKWIPANEASAQAETDPVYSASAAAGITSSLITNWNTSYGWGNHASAGYSTFSGSYTDLTNKPTIPTKLTDLRSADGELISDGTAGQFLQTDGSGNLSFTTIAAASITTTQITNFNTAYGWGNHASAGYSTFSGSYNDLSNKPDLSVYQLASAAFSGNYTDLSNKPTIPTSILNLGISDGTSGQVLTTNGNGGFTFSTVSGGGSQNIFSKINVSGNNSISATTTATEIEFAAGSNMTISTNSSTGVITFASTGGSGGGSQNVFSTIAVPGKNSVTAGSTTDTLTLEAGSNMTINTDQSNNKITFVSASTGAQTAFTKIAVAGKSTVESDGVEDTLTLIAGSNISIDTDSVNDSITLTGTVGSIDNLSDVDITTTAPTDGQILIWNASSSKFIPGASAGNDTLANVTARGATTNDAVTINNTLTVTDITSTGLGFSTLTSASDISLNPTGVVNVNTSRIINVATATSANDAVNKSYVDDRFSTITWVLGNNGYSSNYTFTGPGFPSTTNDPVLYLYRGFRYVFDNRANTSHPFQIRNANGGTAFGVGTSVIESPTNVYTFTVPMDLTGTLYYQCTNHSAMGNTINIV